MLLSPVSSITLLGFAAFAAMAHAQEVYPGHTSAPLTLSNERPAFIENDEPTPPAEGPDPLDGKVAINPKGGKASVEINPGEEVSAVPKRFQYAFRLTLRGVYDDNIFLSEFNEVDGYYFAIEPGVTLGYGDIVGRSRNYIRLDYAPSIFLFVDNDEANAIQHLIRLEGQYSFPRLALGFSQDVHFLEGTNLGAGTGLGVNPVPGINLDAGGDTDVNVFNTRGTFAYDLTGKTFLSGGAHFTANHYDNGLIDSQTISGNLFINYNYSPKLVLGLGATAGYNWVESFNPDQTFEQINVRATYQATGKISLNAMAGFEFRQIEEDYGAGDYYAPVYELGAVYQPFDGTTVTVRGQSRTQNSAVLVGNNYASTNLTVGVRQRFLRRVYFGVAAGYEHSEYSNTIQFVDDSRRDNYFFIQPAVDITITPWWTVGAYYLHRENDSNSPFFSFDNNQYGLRTSLTY